mgnify:CR=1 FL=1
MDKIQSVQELMEAFTSIEMAIEKMIEDFYLATGGAVTITAIEVEPSYTTQNRDVPPKNRVTVISTMRRNGKA